MFHIYLISLSYFVFVLFFKVQSQRQDPTKWWWKKSKLTFVTKVKRFKCSTRDSLNWFWVKRTLFRRLEKKRSWSLKLKCIDLEHQFQHSTICPNDMIHTTARPNTDMWWQFPGTWINSFLSFATAKKRPSYR